MEPYLGQICLFAFGFVPQGWALCDGSLLPIAQNNALYALLGTFYGGDGRTTFALPDLRGRTAICIGQGPGLSNVSLGESSGSESVSIGTAQMPAHNHGVSATASLAASATATSAAPSGLVPATTAETGGSVVVNAYGAADGTQLAGNAATVSVTCAPAGGGQPVNVRNPYLGLNWCIATQGIFPSRQ